MSKNNQILLDELIKQELKNYDEEISINDFFEYYASLQVLKEYELSYDEIYSGITGKSNDGGADSVYLFVNGELVKEDENVKDKYKKNVDIEFILIQAKYENSFNEDTLLKFSKLCRNLLDLDFERSDFEGRYSDRILSVFELFKQTYVGLITKKPKLNLTIFYISKGDQIHPNVHSQADELKADIVKKLPGATTEVKFIGADQLMMLTQERVNDVFRLKISDNPLSTTGQVFIALSNLKDYYEFISDNNGKLIKHIFESNVRDYQGKTNVNSEIQETLEKTDGEEFWWLNNGVTILASEASAPGGKELVIHNPEIVNGLQTSNEIYRFFTKNKSNVDHEKRDVLIRVIVPENEETRDRIIRATNSQTPIPKASLRATDQVHRQIEEYLKPRGLFYDRRKNFYKNEGKKPKDIISVPFMSQCLMSSLMQKPDYARARPSTLLEDDRSYHKLFHKNNDLSTYYFLAAAGRQIENELKSFRTFSTSEINDIKFYVLYATTSIVINDIYPDNNAISKLQPTKISKDAISAAIYLVYDLYKSLGGNEKVAKGSNLIDELKKQLRTLMLPTP